MNVVGVEPPRFVNPDAVKPMCAISVGNEEVHQPVVESLEPILLRRGDAGQSTGRVRKHRDPLALRLSWRPVVQHDDAPGR